MRVAGETGIPIQPRYDNLKETGRTSASKGDTKPGRELTSFGDSVQNLNRAPGLRECYTARPGCVLVSVDWAAAELHGLAQCAIDLGLDSNMARILNSGLDIHTWYACQVGGYDYAWAREALKGLHGEPDRKRIKTARQGAKACNFGFPGGLGSEKFRMYAAKTYQAYFTDEEARALKGIWLDAFPEMTGYFKHVNDLINSGDPLVHFGSGRYRGGVRYTSAANSYFQGRIADMAKDAGWRLARAQYVDRTIPARTWAFAHDEFLVECLEADAHDVAIATVEIMEAAGLTWCPAVPVRAEPAICRSWRKGAEPTYDLGGRLIPWEDRPCDPSTAEKIRKDLALGVDPLYTSWVYGFTEDRIRGLQ